MPHPDNRPPPPPASMRPRGQTPWMPTDPREGDLWADQCFNEATGADPVDASRGRNHELTLHA